MLLKRKGLVNLVLSMGLIAFLIGGCAKPVKKAGVSPITSEIIKEPVKIEEEPKLEEIPSQIKVEDIEASLESKKYPGIEGEFMESSELKDCYFDFDKYNLTDEARKILVRNAEVIRAIPGSKIQVEGHCDERGTKEYNLALGERRAMSVKNYLVFLGISDQNISTISYGEEMPVDPGHTEEAWAKNRRGHTIILSKP